MAKANWREKAKARCEAATEGPWSWQGYDLQNALGVEIADDGSAGGEYGAAIDTNGPDATFIAHARTDLPRVLELLERIRLHLENMKGQGHCQCDRCKERKALLAELNAEE